MNKRINKSILAIAIAIVAIVAMTAVSFAAWTNKLEVDKDFTIKMAEITHLEFGGDGGVTVDGLAEPNAELRATVTVKSSNEKMNVKFGIVSIKVCLSGATEYVLIDEADKDIFALSVTNGATAVTKDGVDMNFVFKMKAVVDQKYSDATYIINVSAIGVKA